MNPAEQRDALLRAVFFDDPDAADLEYYVDTHFGGDYAAATRFAYDCVRSRSVIPPRPAPAGPTPRAIRSDPDRWGPDDPTNEQHPD